MEGSRAGESDFMRDYRENVNLETDKLSVSDKKNITWVSKNISFVLAWINNYLT